MSENKKKVLIVDDETPILDILEVVFKSQNYEVIKCADGKEGLERALELAGVERIISDVEMPHMTGPAFVQELVTEKTRRGETLPAILYMTGGRMDVAPSYQGENAKYLQKPFKDIFGPLKWAENPENFEGD